MPTTTQIDTTLNVNAVGARTDFAGSAVDDVSAEEIRYFQTMFSEGVLEPTDAFQVVAGAGGTMNVIVGSGSAKTDYAYVSGDIAGQGNYLVRLDDVSKTITLSAPDASQDRIDEIWLVVLDNVYDSSTKALPILAVREGDVGSGAPGADSSWEASLKLATITVPGGSSDITEATIQDNRVTATLNVPSIVADDGLFGGVDVTSLDADTVDGQHASDFAPSSHVGAGGSAHADAVAGGADGFMTGSDKSKLDGIESGATADQSAAEILASIKTVDGSGSGLDADTVDGSHASSFATSGHTHGYVTKTGDTNIGNLSSASSSWAAGFVSEDRWAVNEDGILHASRTSGIAVYLNRNGTDGQILAFHKSGSLVGSFEAVSGGLTLSGSDLTYESGRGPQVPGSGTTDLFWPGVRRINDPNWGSLRLEGDNGYRMYFHTSTKYLKDNDENIPYEDSMLALGKLEPKTYDTNEGKRAIGFFAENVQQAEPLTAPEPRETELGPDEVPSYGFDGIIAHLVNGVNYLAERVGQLEAQLAEA